MLYINGTLHAGMSWLHFGWYPWFVCPFLFVRSFSLPPSVLYAECPCGSVLSFVRLVLVQHGHGHHDSRYLLKSRPWLRLATDCMQVCTTQQP